MEVTDLLNYCRYYHGETEPPHEYDQNAQRFWQYEKAWILINANDDAYISRLIRDYFAAGLQHFCETDDTPISLKALLFNRYEHWGGTPEEFQKFYTEVYCTK